jgi:putative membrane protein
MSTGTVFSVASVLFRLSDRPEDVPGCIGVYGPGWMGMERGWMAIGLITTLLLWVALIFLILWLYRQIRGPSTQLAPGSALGVLKRRYAAGEITKEEFEERKKDLM